MHQIQFRRWGWTNEHGQPNASIGMSLSSHPIVPLYDFEARDKWRWLRNWLTTSITILRFEFQFRWFCPGEWSVHILLVRDYPDYSAENTEE